MEVNKKTVARENAFKLLYQANFRGENTALQALDELFMLERDLPQRNFTLELLEGVLEHRSELLSIIESSLQHCSLKAIGQIDLAILLLGTYELLYRPDIPLRVSINEAVNLAKKFSSKDSFSFVNGILDNIVRSKGISK